MDLRAGTPERLVRHVCGQIANLYPLSDLSADMAVVDRFLAVALARMESIVDSVRSFRSGYFDHLNTLQYASFIYLLGNAIHRALPGEDIVDRLFGLNRMVSGLELFPAVILPEPFFLSHALGSVLGNASFGPRLVVFQNVTVGRVGDNRPQIGERVVLFPGVVVTGRSVIGSGSVVAAGTIVHNQEVPPNSLISSGGAGLRVDPLQRDYQSLYFR